ncbi:MAG: 3-oxoadipate enol-lactonase [Solirubrobacteraceae bacterium]
MIPVDLDCEVHGPADAPALLLGGSLGTTRAIWDPQVTALADRHRLVAFDHRGHGGSPVPNGPYAIADLGRDVLALMDRLALPRASYCGLSIGGMVGQWLASNAPDRIERLVLICTSARLPPAHAWHERAATVRAAGSPAGVAEAVVGRWFTPAWARRNPELVERHRRMICATPAGGYAACCEAIATMDLRPALKLIAAPTLVIAGRQDPSIPPEHGAAIAAEIPGARLEMLDPAAHLASVEQAAAVTALIAGHLGASQAPSQAGSPGVAGDGVVSTLGAA